MNRSTGALEKNLAMKIEEGIVVINSSNLSLHSNRRPQHNAEHHEKDIRGREMANKHGGLTMRVCSRPMVMTVRFIVLSRDVTMSWTCWNVSPFNQTERQTTDKINFLYFIYTYIYKHIYIKILLLTLWEKHNIYYEHTHICMHWQHHSKCTTMPCVGRLSNVPDNCILFLRSEENVQCFTSLFQMTLLKTGGNFQEVIQVAPRFRRQTTKRGAYEVTNGKVFSLHDELHRQKNRPKKKKAGESRAMAGIL